MSERPTILNPSIEEYLRGLGPAPHPVLARMEERARASDFPIVGPLVGAMLQVLIRSAGVRVIFELGSGFGYSALWMALALPDDGTITCTETSGENVERARAYLEEAGVAGKVEFLQGDGLEILARRSETFDLIFSDVDKRQYPETLPLVLPRLRTGGLFLTDNVLWSGRVTEPAPDESTRAILEFTRLLYAAKELETTIVPLRDGVSVSVKL